MKKFLLRIKAFIDYLWLPSAEEESEALAKWVPVHKQHEGKGDGQA